MVLNESELSQRAARDTLPLRDAFAVLFFVSVGMLFDPMILVKEPLAVLGALVIVVIGKSAAAWLLVSLLGDSRRTAMTISVSLAQIGEFAFILAGLGISLGLLDEEGRNLVLAAAILSIMLNPVLFTLLGRYLAKNETMEQQTLEEALEEEQEIPVDVCNHAVIVGYGRVGNLLCEQLIKLNIPVVVVESSIPRVKALRDQGIRAVLANAARANTLVLARVDCANWLLVTIPNGYEVGEIVTAARQKQADIDIIVHAHYDDEVEYILERGANHVVMGEREIAASIIQKLQEKLTLQEEKPSAKASTNPSQTAVAPLNSQRFSGASDLSALTIPVGLFQAVFTLRQTARQSGRMLIQDLIADPVSIFADLRQRRIGQISTRMFTGVRYVAAMVVIRRNVMQQRCQRAVPCSIGIHDLLRAAHVGRDVRENA